MDKEEMLRRHRELTGEGWVRRFTSEEPRLTEMKEYYETLGLEVHVEPGALDETGECMSCFNHPGFEDRYRTIYTRGEESSRTENDELF